MRSVIYENQLYPNYSKKAIIADKVEGWRAFLTDLGVGHDLNSTDLRAIPGSELLNKLKPMLSDPDLVFTLEFSSGLVVKEIQMIADNFEREVPRQSSSYIVSTAANSTSLLPTAPTKQAATQQDTNLEKYSKAVHAAESNWNSLYYLKSYALEPQDGGTYKWEASDIESPWPGTTVASTCKKVEEKVQGIKYTVPEFSDANAFSSWKDSLLDNKTWEGIKSSLDQARLNALSSLNFGAPNSNLKVGLSDHTPDSVYKSSNLNAKRFTEAIKTAETFILDYLKMLMNLLDQRAALEWAQNIVIRFYPQNATISEPIPTVNTVPLSENSFVQVASPQQNIMISLIGNMALDTPDTQWRELYAKIFKAILKHGNPPCKARIGRYLIDKCYLFQVTDLSQTTNSAPVFNVSLISEHYDTNNLQSINYVG